MAVRPIDAIELQKRMCALCNQDYADEPCEPSDCIFIRALNETPTLTQPNEPLTLEQLQEMNGQPVWVEELNLWALVDLMYARGNELVMVLFGDGDIEVRNVELYNLHCYRRPPEEEV